MYFFCTFIGESKLTYLVTSAEKKQATTTYLESLEGDSKVEKVVSDLTAAKLNTDNGMTLLLEKPNNVFQSQTVDEVYILMKYHAFIIYIFLKNWEYEYEGSYIRIWTSLLQNDTV